MTGKDALDQFNLLYNNIDSNIAVGLEPIEIAFFLTKAQEEVVKNYFNNKSNTKQEGYNYSPKRDSDFRNIISTKDITITNNEGQYANTNILFPLYEFTTVDSKNLPVVTLTAEEYLRVSTKPYPYPPKTMVWKVYIDANKFKLITPNSISSITLTYVKNPTPIDSNFYTNDNWCELSEHLHPEVIQRAVEIAKGVWQGDINTTIQLGQRSE